LCTQENMCILEKSNINTLINGEDGFYREDDDNFDNYIPILKVNKNITRISVDEIPHTKKTIDELENRKETISLHINVYGINGLLILLRNNNLVKFGFSVSLYWYDFTNEEKNNFNNHLRKNKSIMHVVYPDTFKIEVYGKNILYLEKKNVDICINIEKRNMFLINILRRKIKRKFFM
jgi:hypothetical protein